MICAVAEPEEEEEEEEEEGQTHDDRRSPPDSSYQGDTPLSLGGLEGPGSPGSMASAAAAGASSPTGSAWSPAGSPTSAAAAGAIAGRHQQLAMSASDRRRKRKREKKTAKVTKESKRRALVHVYRQLKFLENFCIVNYTAFVKAVKKFNKNAVRGRGGSGGGGSGGGGAAGGAAGGVGSVVIAGAVALEDPSSSGGGGGGGGGGGRALETQAAALAAGEARRRAELGEQLMEEVHAEAFHGAAECTALLEHVEKTFAEIYCEGNLSVARTTLLLKQNKDSDWWTMWFGIRVGVLLMLLCWVMWDCIVDELLRPNHDFHFFDRGVFRVYRGIGCLILLNWLWGVNIFVWTSVRINYAYLFEFDANAIYSHRQVFMRATSLTLFWLLNFLLFFKMNRGEVFEGSQSYNAYLPLSLAVAALLYVLSPFNKQKRVFARGIVKAVTAPFSEVSFFSVYVADVMTSLVKVFGDLAYSFCYFGTGEWLALNGQNTTDCGNVTKADLPNLRDHDCTCEHSDALKWVVYPLLSSLPLWFRFMQNLRKYRDTHRRFPFLANGLKYAVAQTVVVFGIFNPSLAKTHVDMTPARAFWILAFVASTCYTFAWDVKMDWGLGHRSNHFLRPRRMYSRRYVYYLAIGADLLLRFVWTLSIIPSQNGNPFIPGLDTFLSPLIAAAELCRRCMWGCFRLENEHLHNTEGYRRIDVIPLHFETPLKEDPAAERRRQLSGRLLVSFEVASFVVVVVALAIMAIFMRR